jgi:DNA-binding response OmpR family regulator
MIDKQNKSKILVCDDDQGILDIVSIILESNDYQVKTLNNGKSIEKKISDYKPDLILLDLWMPGADGKEVTKILKRQELTKNIPIIIVSALNETEKISKEIGADGFLAKPFDMNDLLLTVEKMLSNNSFK